MKKYKVSDTFYYAKTRDWVGGTIRTDVHLQDNGFYKAYSSYWQDEDEEIVGYAESYDDEQAVMLSRKDLRKEWIEEQERKASGIEKEEEEIVIHMASGKVI